MNSFSVMDAIVFGKKKIHGIKFISFLIAAENILFFLFNNSGFYRRTNFAILALTFTLYSTFIASFRLYFPRMKLVNVKLNVSEEDYIF